MAVADAALMGAEELDATSVRRILEDIAVAVKAPPPPPHPVKDIVLPLAVVIGLIGNAWWGGVGWGKVSTQLESIINTLATTVAAVSTHDKEITELQARVASQEKELRLFKMYTKGRIARLPYRASDDGE
jgi:hypothetical protein